MAISGGPAPWNHQDYWEFRQGFKPMNKRQQKQAGVEWNLSSGWRTTTKDDWDKNPKKVKMHEARLFNGRKVKIPDGDYKDFIGHRARPSSDMDGDLGEFLSNAFAEDKKIHSVKGKGHITLIEYSSVAQTMRVTFEPGDTVVCYLRVPRYVYTELEHLANSDQTMPGSDGTMRHVVGIKFWDIIRIRGQRTGGRYDYIYSAKGTYIKRGSARSRAAAKSETKVITEAAEDKMADSELLKEAKEWRHMLSPRDKELLDNAKTGAEATKILTKAGIW